jgi:radical SAM superfamily enzyme YgiQ (UPF0313 family)
MTERYSTRVLLIGPLGGTDKMYHSPPLGIHRLRSYLERNGVEAVVVDPTIEEIPDCTDFDIVGYSVLGWSVERSIAHANGLQLRDDQILVFGGYEATFNYFRIIELCTHRHFCVGLGESEKALLHLATTMDSGSHQGLIWVRDGEIESQAFGVSLNAGEFADVTLNLDYEGIPFGTYWAKNEEKIGADFDASETRVIRLYIKNRCSFKCDFCSSANFYEASTGATPRVHTIDPVSVADLLVRLKKNFPEVRTFFFQDDEIFVPKTFIKPFLEEIVSRPELEGLSYICQGRIDAIHPTLLPLMKQARFRTAILGLENFAQNVLTELAPGKLVGYKRYSEMVGQLLDYDVMPFINIILTTPGARVEDLLENVECCLNELERGCEIGMNLYTNNWAGSAMAARPDYEVDGFNFLPKDLKVREIIRITDQGYNHLLKWIGDNYGPPNIKSSSRSLLFLYFISRQLDNHAYVQRCRDLMARYHMIPSLDDDDCVGALEAGIEVCLDWARGLLGDTQAERNMPFPTAQEVSSKNRRAQSLAS